MDIKKYLLVLSAILFIATPSFAQTFLVERVIDGDTIKLSNGERVRLIGVDTPETVHPRKPVEYYGKEASTFTKRMCEGKRVRLKYGKIKRGKYKRILAYVYLLDGTHLNAEIIKRGYGYAYLKYPFKYSKEFSRYEVVAQKKGVGLWGQRKLSYHSF